MLFLLFGLEMILSKNSIHVLNEAIVMYVATTYRWEGPFESGHQF